MSPQRSAKLAVQWLALLVVPMLVVLAALELFARATRVDQRVAAEVSRRMYPRPETGGENDLFATRIFDPVLSWRLKPNSWLPGRSGRINSLGFVGPEFEWLKPPGTTHGRRIGLEGREPRNPTLQKIVRGAAHLASYRALTGLSALVFAREPSAPTPGRLGAREPRVTLDDFAYHLEELVRLARERGAHVLFVTEPAGPSAPLALNPPWLLEGVRSYKAWIALHEAYNDRTRAVASRLDVPTVDAAAEFDRRDKSKLFDRFDLVHPNEAGHALLADLIAERMLREGWLSRPGR